MLKYSKLTLALVSCFVLNACGGGSSGSSDTPTTPTTSSTKSKIAVTVQTVAGEELPDNSDYVVCLDINGSNTCDNNEPKQEGTVSNEAGFTVNLEWNTDDVGAGSKVIAVSKGGANSGVLYTVPFNKLEQLPATSADSNLVEYAPVYLNSLSALQSKLGVENFKNITGLENSKDYSKVSTFDETEKVFIDSAKIMGLNDVNIDATELEHKLLNAFVNINEALKRKSSSEIIYAIQVSVTKNDDSPFEEIVVPVVDNKAPVASFTAKIDGYSVTLTNNSTDPNNDKLYSFWNFGDSSKIVSNNDLRQVSHTYTKSGTYLITLNVSDGDKGSRYNLEVIINCYGDECSVTNKAPTADFTYATEEGSKVVRFKASASDPENDPLTYEWVFGDGGMSKSNDNTITYIYNDYGTYNVSLVVSDGKNRVPVSHYVVVSNGGDVIDCSSGICTTECKDNCPALDCTYTK
ncbi:MAG: PKD domain-containing protein [Succinivibrionaceae bacterium]